MEVSYEEFCRAMAGKTVQQRIGYRLYKETKAKLEAAEQAVRRLCEENVASVERMNNLADMVLRASVGDSFTEAQEASPERQTPAVFMVQDLMGGYQNARKELAAAVEELRTLKESKRKRTRK